MQVSSVLQQCMEDDLLLVAIDTQHRGSHHKTTSDGCLKINVKNVPTSAGCPLATHPKSGSSGSRRIGLLILLLFVLLTS